MRTYFRDLFGFFEVEGTSKGSAHGAWESCLFEGSSLYNYVYSVAYVWLCGVVVVALWVWVWEVGGSILADDNKLVHYFLRSDSLLHGQADYFWGGQDNCPKSSHGDRGNDLYCGQGDC